ncbi:MAG: cob(I)yrinic acid a,c-diamide adenosyltransferase [Candidatus Binatia bacterium]|nr:cob(I)yrinic acid a,c-diamide adenosyltransferase [Candidatus Binatia bacterium]
MAIRINRVYTRTGDKGQTRLVGGAAVRKDSTRVEAYGTVDELNSVLGLARTFNEEALQARPAPSRRARKAAQELDEILKRLQNELFDLGSELATPPGETYPGMMLVGDGEIRALEGAIDRCQEDLDPLPSFILPGGGRVSAFLHQARTVCRRAERDVLRLTSEENIENGPLRYLNRLSDLLFVQARWIALHTGSPEYLWERGVRLGPPMREAPQKTKKKAVAKKKSTGKKAVAKKKKKSPAKKTPAMRKKAPAKRKKESRR